MNSRNYLLLLISATLLVGCGVPMQQVRDPSYTPSYPIVMSPPQASNGSIYRPGFGLTLFADSKAQRVGDLLTIQLVEQTNASKSATTTTAKDSSMDLSAASILGAPVLYGGNQILNNSADFSREFSGDGSSSQSNSLSGSITVTVAEVMPNGNLIVRGEKVVSINQGDEFIRFSGIVRPIDVSPNNTIFSTQVANAEVTYGGSGIINEVNKKGWLARFFDSPFMPF